MQNHKIAADNIELEKMEDDIPFRPRMMTHPGTRRHPLSRPRFVISQNGLPSSQGSSQIWVVQVSPSAQTIQKTQKIQANGNVSSDALDDDGKERNLEKFKTARRAIELLSREYDSVLSNTSTATKIASEIQSSSKSGPSLSEPTSNKSPDSMLAGMVPAIFLGQCFSLLGVNNASGRNGKPPEFRWVSFRVLYSVLMSVLLAINAILAVIDLLRRDAMTLGGSQVVAFYFSSFIASCLYLRLSTHWTSLCAAFQHMESRMSFYGNSSGLARRMKSLTAVILILALAEHSLAQLNTFVEMERTMANRTMPEWLHSYFDGNFRHVSFYVPFSPLVAVLSIAVNMSATFIWNYNDLFIMLISVAISWRFRVLNDSLVSTAHEEKDVPMWRHARETFNVVSNLTRTVDCSLSVHLLLSFVNNLYFICLQLLHTVRHDKNHTVYMNIYFACSFGFLLLRAVAVSLLAASIYDESRALKRVLFSVSSDSYCTEVDRFLVQVTTDDIALTGCNFFNVTRSLLLTVAGTITTYEVVLVQFNGLNSDN